MIRKTTIAAGAVVTVVALAILAVVVTARTAPEGAPCGAGFTRVETRCCPSSNGANGVCRTEPGAACPAPLVTTDHGCDAREHDVVDVPATMVLIGPADWEAEGRVKPRTVTVDAFAIDRLEVTTGRFCAGRAGTLGCIAPADGARAASGMSFEQARDFCVAHGGRLPTEDEWLAAAGGERPRRYPWGDTGAVCRRAAWGLESGPCGEGATGPDTVGAHPEGMTPLGIHDLAGNVSEWIDPGCPSPTGAAGERCPRIVRGGSWRTRLATELRTWLRREVSPNESNGDATIGFRCAYEPNRR